MCTPLCSLLLMLSAASPGTNVVLLTWDGVRREDFVAPDRLPQFWSSAGGARGGVVLGGPTGAGMEVANTRLLSLPAYQSIFAGAVTSCADNACGRLKEETLAERLVRELSLSKDQVAVFASWKKVASAVEHTPGTITVDAGLDGTTAAPPWEDARWDEDTVARAMRYLDEKRPRFLYISLNDADEWAHQGEREKYQATLLQYDRWLTALNAKLALMGEYGKRTTVIVTTDHGRGAGARWTEHGVKDPNAKWIWLYARGPSVKPGVPSRKNVSTHLNLRPTIEALLGLCSAKQTIPEIAAAVPCAGK